MRIVVDTGVFFHPAALRALSDADEPVVVPTVVLAERARQLSAAGRKEPEAFLEDVAGMGFIVEPLAPRHALRVAPRVHDPRRWRRLGFDALIAGHVGDDDTLWTTNPRDFAALGIPVQRIVPVPDGARFGSE